MYTNFITHKCLLTLVQTTIVECLIGLKELFKKSAYPPNTSLATKWVKAQVPVALLNMLCYISS